MTSKDGVHLKLILHTYVGLGGWGEKYKLRKCESTQIGEQKWENGPRRGWPRKRGQRQLPRRDSSTSRTPVYVDSALVRKRIRIRRHFEKSKEDIG